MQISNAFLICGAALSLVTLSARAADTEKDAQLREALRQKIAESNIPAAAPQTPAAAPQAPAAAPAIKPEPAMAVSSAEDDAQTARLREALRLRMAEESTKVVAPTQTVTQKETIVTGKPTPSTSASVKAPPLPIPSTKEERLAQLLKQYKADEITPQEYHQQRAKIMAE